MKFTKRTSPPRETYDKERKPKLVFRFLNNISISGLLSNSCLLHFPFPSEDSWHLIDLIKILIVVGISSPMGVGTGDRWKIRCYNCQ